MSRHLPQTSTATGAPQGLAATAAHILTTNDRGGYTVPSAKLYPYQWLWDAGFIALGWQKCDEARAWQELRSLIKGQWPDGMIPHIVFHATHSSYMPGPEMWGVAHTPPTSGITHPPILGTVLRRLYEQAADKPLADAALRELFAPILRFNRWFHRARDPHHTGLVACFHPWETGMDNSPAWDAPLQRVPTDNLRPYTRKDIGHVDPAQRPHKDDYDRYMSLVFGAADLGHDQTKLYAQTPFKVADLLTNAILIRSDRDLLALAEDVLRDPAAAQELRAAVASGHRAMNGLWDAAAEFFYSRDLILQTPIDVPTAAGFMPLFAGTATPAQAETLARQYTAWRERVRYGIPTIDPRHAAFDAKRYWCGPVWINLNWMIAQGFADYGHDRIAAEIRADTVALIENGGCAEYFDPTTGTPLGAQNFSWTAALALHWQLFTA